MFVLSLTTLVLYGLNALAQRTWRVYPSMENNKAFYLPLLIEPVLGQVKILVLRQSVLKIV